MWNRLMRQGFFSSGAIRRLTNGNVFQPRTAVTSSTGSMLAKPTRYHALGLIKITAVSGPFMFIGAMIAKYTASQLEELDLFVPDDDDD